MSAIEQIRQEHEDLARTLKKHPGMRKIVEDLYPDTAHFIYELLQNAEDADATEAAFVLSGGALVFEHNGRPFDESDIRGINDIGKGTKAEDEDRIGRFGIGFKAVFAYTETPRIWSPKYAFEIREMVRPWEISPKSDLAEDRTRFEFPFNSDKKPQADAFSEVRDSLQDISDSTLLFLSKIEEIQWRVDGGREGRLLRIPNSEHHLEILREIDGARTKSSHFLRFAEPVDGLDRQFAAIAFELEPLSNDGQTDALASFAKRFRIVPADPGCVAVSFTAKKETSKLRFHLHAPFVPELSRASIKDTRANDPLFQQLAKLAARSLCEIRDLGLLDRDFLTVLPNDRDSIPDRYKVIRQAIVDAMNRQPLTPTQTGGHAPAGQLLQAEAGLKALLNQDDIRFLRDDNDLCGWAVARTQRNNCVDRFLSDLDIRQWGVKEFVNTIENQCSDKVENLPYWCPPPKPDLKFLEWMSKKPVKWHRKLYALFFRELSNELKRFKHVCIVRCSDDEFKKGSACYFPTPETRADPIHPRVAANTFTGGAKKESKDAKAFLEGIGVGEVGERERVKDILERRYAAPDNPPSWKNHESDLRRFIVLTEKDASAATLFKGYFIFQKADGGWSRPNGSYLDSPYLDTGLKAYYSHPCLDPELSRAPLSGRYRTFDRRKQLVGFAKRCGVSDRLKINEVTCDHNPQKEDLHGAPGTHPTHTGTDQDFTIHGLDALLEKPTLSLSRLVWKTLSDQSNNKEILRATYRKNRSNDPRHACSSLIHLLRNASWIPQGSDNFASSAKVSRDRLPDGFPYDAGWPWLDAIRFGADTEQHRQTQDIAATLGFRNQAALEEGKKFAAFPPEIRRKFFEGQEPIADLPTSKTSNPDRRAKKTQEEAWKAPERKTDIRQRSVSVNRAPIKSEYTTPYLLDEYTNADHVTICQACRGSLPFKLPDGNYYFEAVEFLEDLKKHHYQNYLILCPNHAAMFKHANGSRDEMKSRFMVLDGNDLNITLAGQQVSLHFTDTHTEDLRVVLEVDDEE